MNSWIWPVVYLINKHLLSTFYVLRLEISYQPPDGLQVVPELKNKSEPCQFLLEMRYQWSLWRKSWRQPGRVWGGFLVALTFLTMVEPWITVWVCGMSYLAERWQCTKRGGQDSRRIGYSEEAADGKGLGRNEAWKRGRDPLRRELDVTFPFKQRTENKLQEETDNVTGAL